MLFGKKEPSNGVDKNAIAVICLNSFGREEVVGQVSQNISKVVPLCFSLCHIVTWNRGGGNGLGIPTRFRSYGPEKATQWLETILTKIEEQLKESVNSYLK